MNINKEVMLLNLKDVLPNRFQPRIIFNETDISELAESIKEHGVIQPIVVRKIADKYEIIAGERRYKASIMAGKTTIPAIVTDLNDKDSAEIALIENIQRSNLTPIEEAISYKKILDMGYLSQSDLALKLGKTQSTIANKLRLLNLSENVQEELLKGRISERHARSLLRLSKEEQEKMVKRIINERLTVRKTDEEIEKIVQQTSKINIEKPKQIEKYTLEDENNGEGENKNMNNNQFGGNFNIPTTPILEKDPIKNTQDTASSTVKNGSINSGVSSEMKTSSPMSSPAQMSMNQNNIANNKLNSQIENNNSMSSGSSFVSPSSTPSTLVVPTPTINNSASDDKSKESHPTITPNISANASQINNNVSSNMSADTNIDINSNKASNVDPTNPAPITGGKFFNMFSESDNSDNDSDISGGSNTQINSNPVVPPINPTANSINSSLENNVFTSQMPNSTVVTPEIMNRENQNPAMNNSFVTPSAMSQSINPAVVNPTPINNVGPVPNNSYTNVNSTVMNRPISNPQSVNNPVTPVSIDTVPSANISEEPSAPINMTPLQTYRLNDDQTFENSSVVELGTFGRGQMEEAVLQPLRMEEVKKVKAPMKDIINTIRDCAKTIENLGYVIDTDEIDFEDNYQVTFKIMKEED